MNYLLHCSVIEIFMAICVYRYTSTIFQITKDKKKYVAFLAFLKSCIYNVGTLYLSYIGYLEASYRNGIMNMFCVIIVFSVYKLLTGLDYVKIVFGTVLSDLLCVATICVPYLLIYAIANNDFSFEQTFEKAPGVYVILAIFAIIIVNYLIERYILNKFLKNFKIWKIPFKNLFRLMCIIWLIWIMYTYSVQERATVTWFYTIIHLMIAFVLLYISSWFYRYRENKKIQVENQQLNYENKVMKQYCETLEQQVEAMEQFRDDITKHMEEVDELAKEANDNDDIKQYAEELKETYKEIHQKVKRD